MGQLSLGEYVSLRQMDESPSINPKSVTTWGIINLFVYQTGVLSTHTMYVLINNEIKLCIMLHMVAEFGFMWFPDVVFAILFRRRCTSQNLLNGYYQCVIVGTITQFDLMK